MKLTLIGHDDRYAVEQLQMALFPQGTQGSAVSAATPRTATAASARAGRPFGERTRSPRSANRTSVCVHMDSTNHPV